jgi:hypothetical protein
MYFFKSNNVMFDQVFTKKKWIFLPQNHLGLDHFVGIESKHDPDPSPNPQQPTLNERTRSVGVKSLCFLMLVIRLSR